MSTNRSTLESPSNALGTYRYTPEAPWWMRGAIVCVVLASSMALGLIGSPLLTVAVVAAPIGLYVFARWPAIGMLLSVLAGFAVPYYGPSGLNVMAMGITLLFGIWVVQMVVNRRANLAAPRITLALFAILATYILGFSIGLLPWFSATHAPLAAQLGGIAIVFLSVAAFLIMANQMRTLASLKIVTWGIVAYGCLYLLIFSPGIGPLATRLFTYGSAGALFMIWVPTMAASQALFNRSLPAAFRLLLALVVAIFLYVSFVTNNDWKSGWMPLLAAFAGMALLWSFKSAFVLGAIAAVPVFRLLVEAVQSDEYSYSTRLDAWQILWEIVRVNPVTGLGPANYYWYTPLYAIRGYFVRFNSHNQYVDIVAQAGLLGLLAAGWFFAEMLAFTYRLKKRVFEDGFARAYVFGVFGGLIATMVAGFLGDWFLPFFYNIGLIGFKSSALAWIFLGGLIALERMTRTDGDAP